MTYQPIGGDVLEESTVLSRLQSYVHKHHIKDNPRTYMLNVVSKWISSFALKGHQIVIGGDFNPDPRVTAEEHGLVNVLLRTIPTELTQEEMRIITLVVNLGECSLPN